MDVDVRRQRSAALKVSQSSTEPRLKPALNQRMRCSGTSVREGIRHHGPALTALERVVADRGRGVDGFLGVARLEHVAVLADAIGIDAREAVRLQLEAHRELIRGIGIALLQPAHLVGDAEQVLDVVPDLVRHDVSAREVAGGA
jgi:hypothetical protein